MSTFKELTQFEEFTEVCSRCYPGMKLNSQEAKERYRQRRETMDKEKTVRHLGLFEDEKLVGGYTEYAHELNVYQSKLAAAGIGTVAVDLPYKKKGYARAIIQKFIEDARSHKRTVVQLYPFQPTFYRKMGFGLGPALHTFQFHPSQLPTFDTAEPVTVLTPEDKEEVRDCYHGWARQTHGACDKELYEFKFLDLEDFQAVGYKENGKIKGYLVFQFHNHAEDHFLQNDLHILDFITTTEEAYQTLLQFLHNQKDQVRSIKLPTYDEQFSFLLNDPCHTDEQLIFRIFHKTSEQGHGLMYRIVDVPAFIKKIEHHSFGNETIRVGWSISDTLMGEEHYYVCQFTDGYPSLTDEKSDIDIHLTIAEFSSLMMGSVTLEQLIRGGHARTENNQDLSKAFSLFKHPIKPQCWTFF